MKRVIAMFYALLSIEAFTKGPDGNICFTDEQKAKLEAAGLGDDIQAKFIAAFAKDAEKETPESQVLVDTITASMQEKLTASIAEQGRLNVLLTAEKSAKEKAEAAVTEQKLIIARLQKKPEDDPPSNLNDPTMKDKPWIPKSGATHLFAVAEPFFAVDDAHPYNQRAMAAISARHGVSIAAPMHINAAIDYSSLSADLGDFYRTRKQDRIQSFLTDLPSITSVFPTESGVQDQTALVNMFLTEFSQADNTSSTFGNVVKGSFKFEAEIITMFDVMFAHKFTDLKKLEKQWIGYLNKEGSSTMKWSFIEFIMVEVGRQLKNEQEMRWINGIRKNPIQNVSGTAMGASNGFRKFIANQIAAFKIKPFTLGEWTESNIVSNIELGTSMIPAAIRDSGRVVLYMAPAALTAYHKNLEILTGIMPTYKPGQMTVKNYDSVSIEVVPNMGVSKRLVWSIKGNIHTFEDQPNEMLNFSFQQEDWGLKVWSNWKESVWAYLVGKKYASAADMPDDYSTQMIWTNDVDLPAGFYLPMDTNDTSPSIANHTSLISVENSQATAITDFDDAVTGQTIRVKCGPGANPITIAKANKFSLLSAAWTPEPGNVLVIKKRSDGKWIELERITEETDAIVIADGDTTPDVSKGTKFITSSNTAACAITALDNAIYDTEYVIMGGSDNHSSTIANAGNFSLTAAMTLAAGTFIKLQKSRVDDKLWEIDRG